VGLTIIIYVRSMVYRSTSKFLPGLRLVFGSLLFITDKFGDLSLQEPESPEVAGLGTGCLPLALVQVGLVNKARLRHGSSMTGKADPDPSGDKADHNQASPPVATYSIYQSPSELDSDDDRGVYMVGQGEEPTEKTTKEIAREMEEALACLARLEAAAASKRHNSMQDNSGLSGDGAGEGAHSLRHHPKYNQRCPTNRERL
jgi:hypothetical protein